MQTTLVEKINLWQLFVLILLFESGSTVVVGVGMEAKQDAWIAVILATFIGLFIFRMYVFILSFKEGKHLFSISEAVLGRRASIVITYVYILYFFYIGARVLRDFLEMIITENFPNTPIEVLAFTFMLAVIYIIYLGPEVLGRTAETFVPYIIIVLILLFVFLIAGGDIQYENLRPILAEGAGPIMETIFPTLIGFPFGETIVFTIIMANSNNFHHVAKVGLGAVLFSGIVLTFFAALTVSVIGVDMAGRAAFPLLNAAREVAFAEFIERVDAIVVFVMMLGIFVKVSLFFYGGLKGLEYIYQIPYRYFTIPSGAFIAIFSVLIASNYAEHLEEGLAFVPLYLHMPLQIYFPFLLAVLIYWKWKKGGENLA